MITLQNIRKGANTYNCTFGILLEREKRGVDIDLSANLILIRLNIFVGIYGLIKSENTIDIATRLISIYQ